MILESTASILGLALIALVIELVMGWPRILFRAIGHPVTWIGWLVNLLESRLRAIPGATPRHDILKGCASVAVVIFISVGIASFIVEFSSGSIAGQVILIICIASLFASRSLYDHVNVIEEALKNDWLDSARSALARIVSRDTRAMDEATIAGAAIESLAENTSDGVVAPLFWFLLFGLPGLVFYKATNTMDSMIGYRNERYLFYGRCAARLDDLVNYLPARLTALLYWGLASSRVRPRLTEIAEQATPHCSPNAGWPEAAVALCLHIRLGGERSYNGARFAGHVINGAAPRPERDSLKLAIRLYLRLVLLLIVMLGLGWWLSL